LKDVQCLSIPRRASKHHPGVTAGLPLLLSTTALLLFCAWMLGVPEFTMAAPRDGKAPVPDFTQGGKSGVGAWGHKFARPDGNLHGYGAMNSPGIPVAVAMVLTREAGVKDPALDKAINRAASFLRW
jgi:Family of unknown function (DUF6288)